MRLTGKDKKILIIGCCGAGKSTLAVELGKKFDMPVMALDHYYWKPNWVESTTHEWMSTINELVQYPQWIMDGNYAGTLPLRIDHADTIIWLDLPRYLCVYRVLKRFLLAKLGFGRHAGRPHACPEKMDWEFFRFVWNFSRNNRKKTTTLLSQAKGKKIIVLKNLKEIQKFRKRQEEPYAAPKARS